MKKLDKVLFCMGKAGQLSLFSGTAEQRKKYHLWMKILDTPLWRAINEV